MECCMPSNTANWNRAGLARRPVIKPDWQTLIQRALSGLKCGLLSRKIALPYLQYLADEDYCHLYYVDTPSTVIDVSIGGNYNDPKTTTSNSWRTVLIGGMGLGGASKITGSSCTTGLAGTCVKTPILDPSDASKGLGYSSYFALDITTPNDPQVLWEFSHPDLGFSISEPAIVRIGNANQNGKWFAVFASGPTGPIDPNYRQFLGKSDQQLRLFVVDLKTGSLVRTIDNGHSRSLRRFTV